MTHTDQNASNDNQNENETPLDEQIAKLTGLKTKELTDRQQALKIDLQTTDDSLAKLSKKHGWHPSTISKFQAQQNIVRPEGGGKSGPQRDEGRLPISPSHKALGIRIGLYRASRNYTEFGEILGVSRVIVKNMEHGFHDFTLSEMTRIVNILGITLTEALEPYRIPKHTK
jgi:hypothetical protein